MANPTKPDESSKNKKTVKGESVLDMEFWSTKDIATYFEVSRQQAHKYSLKYRWKSIVPRSLVFRREEVLESEEEIISMGQKFNQRDEAGKKRKK